jgi:glycosyltransferase involved in cell wall biosynthesis
MVSKWAWRFMRVAFAYHFHDTDWHGGRNYFSSLFHAIELVRPANVEVVLITGETTTTTLPDEFPNMEVVRTPLLDRFHAYWLLRQLDLRVLNADRLFARFLRSNNIDLLSHSGYLGSNSGIKTLAWLYDFQFIHLPEYWKTKHIRWAEQRYKASCKQCNGVIVSSNSALDDLNRFAQNSKVPKHVLQFVSNPINFSKLSAKEEISAIYKLPEKYLYLPNQFWSNKNHSLVIDALGILKKQNFEATIVCTGKTLDGRRPEYFDALMKQCSDRCVTDQFRVLGIIPYTHTQSLMAHSHAVINPSLFEGWSTTVEEAKTFQKPLLLSDIPVHREQAPTLGKFFPTDDPVQLAYLIKENLSSNYQEINEDSIIASYRMRLKDFGNMYLKILNSTITATN